MAIGIAAASNLVVYGEGYYARISSGYTTDLKSELGLGGFGAGVKYYLIPSNLFISSSLLLSKLVRSDAQPHHSELDETSYWGPVGRFSVGREWWVSPNWSFGLAGEIMLGRMRNYLTSSDNPSYYTVKGGALLLSSSFSAPPSKASHERLPGGGPGLPVDSAGVVSDAPVQAHQGFHLNVRLGGGYFGVSGPQEVSGLGTPIGLSIGFALKRNLILFGEYAWLLVTDPSSGYDYLARLDLRGFGPGLKYYLPLNLFFSGSLLLSQFSFNGIAFRYGVDMTSQWGASVRLAAGHEWLISSHWGLGVACELLLGRMRQAAAWTPGDPAPWYSATGVSVLASASFN